MECVNFPEEVKEQLYKLASICLCPNLSGQICMVSGVAGGLTGGPVQTWTVVDVGQCAACCACAAAGCELAPDEF